MEECFTSTVQMTFSIAVAACLLVSMETRMGKLTKAINELQAGLEEVYRVRLLQDKRKEMR